MSYQLLIGATIFCTGRGQNVCMNDGNLNFKAQNPSPTRVFAWFTIYLNYCSAIPRYSHQFKNASIKHKKILVVDRTSTESDSSI